MLLSIKRVSENRPRPSCLLRARTKEHSKRRPDFSAAHAVLRRRHDERRLSGASALIFQGRDVVDEFCIGEADIEQGQPMRPDHIHRAQSNTKLITAVMTLMLVDARRPDQAMDSCFWGDARAAAGCYVA